MGFINDKLANALFSREYICSECKSLMEFEDEFEDVLVCPNCSHSVDLEHYGFENDEDYDAQYPTKEEVVGYEDNEDYDEDDTGEMYDEVCGELDDD